MENPLIHSDLIEIRKSPIHGWGVFAKQEIKSNTTLEECPFILCEGDGLLKNYYFKYPKKETGFTHGQPPSGGAVGRACRPSRSAQNPNVSSFPVMPLGFACAFNSSETYRIRNADWETDEKRRLFIFRSVKDIEKDKEILTWYGESWWNNRK